MFISLRYLLLVTMTKNTDKKQIRNTSFIAQFQGPSAHHGEHGRGGVSLSMTVGAYGTLFMILGAYIRELFMCSLAKMLRFPS